MLGVRSPCAPTGGTTLRAQTGWCGWWTAQTGSGWRTAGRSSASCCRKRWSPFPTSGERYFWLRMLSFTSNPAQRLAGATLLVFANKQDLPGALSKDAIQEVTHAQHSQCSSWSCDLHRGCSPAGPGPGWDQEPSLVHHWLQRSDGGELAGRSGLVTGRHRCEDLHCRVTAQFQLDPEL